MATKTVTKDLNVDSSDPQITGWVNGDTLVINNGATLVISSNQTKFWNIITINNGKLRIENSSTTTPIRFLMGKTTGSGAVANSITPASGLGSIEIAGNWIDIGTGTGAQQQITVPTVTGPNGYVCDFIPAVWVETSAGSGEYDIWLNITVEYSNGQPFLRNSLNGTGFDTERCKFFTQTEVTEPYTLTNCFSSHWTSTLRFGDDNNFIPNGANIRMPNIIITDVTACNYFSTFASQLVTRTNSAYFNLSNGGSMTVDKALFDESYINATQAQSFSISNSAFAICPLVAECYSFNVNSVGITIDPLRRYSGTSATATVWYNRDNRYWTATWSYINNAIIDDLVLASYGSSAALTGLSGVLNIQYSSNMIINKVCVYSLNKVTRTAAIGNGAYGIYLAYVTNSNFSNCKLYGGKIYSIYGTNIQFDGIKVSDGLFDQQTHCTVNTSTRIGIDVQNKQDLQANQPYYFKVRTYQNYYDLTDYFENPVVYSATPYDGHNAGMDYHPFWFGASLNVLNGAASASTWQVILNWMNVNTLNSVMPIYNAPAYEIYRGTSSGFLKNMSSKIYTTNTTTTITITDANSRSGLLLTAPLKGNTYYYVLRKFDEGLTIASCSGTINSYQITTSNNFNTARGTVARCNALNNSTIINSDYNFTTNNIRVGMPVSGTGIPAGATVTSVQRQSLTISSPTTQSLTNVTLSFGVYPGMSVFIQGTDGMVGYNAKVVSIDSNTQITVDVPNVSTFSSKTLTFSKYTDSAEQIVNIPNIDPTYPAWMGTGLNTADQTNYNNLLLQSSSLATTWVKTGSPTVTNTTVLGIKAAPSATADTCLINFAATNDAVTQNVTVVASTRYVFSVYMRSTSRSNNVTLQAVGTSTYSTTCILNEKWQRFSVVIPDTNAATTVTLGIYANASTTLYSSSTLQGTIYVSCATMTKNILDNNPKMGIVTTTAAAGSTAYQELTAIKTWTKDGNKSIEFTLSAMPTAGIWSEIFMGTSSDFIPSKTNMIATTLITGTPTIYANASTQMIFNNLTKVGYGGHGTGYATTNPFIYLVNVTYSKFTNFVHDMNYQVNRLIDASGYSNENFIHNWTVNKLKNYTACALATTTNNNSGWVFQNIKSNTYDVPLTNYFLNTIFKNVCEASLNTRNYDDYTGAIGSTLDGINITYTATPVYDYIFNENNFGNSKGSLFLSFNASSKSNKPYEITGNAIFSNSGALYMAQNSSITYTWPHKLYGIGGFRKIRPLLNTSTLGSNVRMGDALLLEYSISMDNINWTNFQEATADNLYNEFTNINTFNGKTQTEIATNGFYLKIRITPRLALAYTARTTDFVIGETIGNASSAPTATCRIVANIVNEDTYNAGTLLVDNVGGSSPLWLTGTTIYSGATARATVAPNATYGVYIPQIQLSYINGLQIYTYVNENVLYPISYPTLTLTNLQSNSEIKIYKQSDSSLIAGSNDIQNNTSWSSKYEYFGEDIIVDIIIHSLGYNYLKISNITLGENNLTIPVNQTIDRNYKND